MTKLSKENKAILNMLKVIAPENAKVVTHNINYGKRLHKAIIKHVELSTVDGSEYLLNTASGMIEELKHVNRKVVELLDMARVEVGEYLLCGTGSSDCKEHHVREYRFSEVTPFDLDGSSLELDDDEDNPF